MQLRRMAFFNKIYSRRRVDVCPLSLKVVWGPPVFISLLGFTYIELQVYKLLPKSECRFYLGGMTLSQGPRSYFESGGPTSDSKWGGGGGGKGAENTSSSVTLYNFQKGGGGAEAPPVPPPLSGPCKHVMIDSCRRYSYRQFKTIRIERNIG